MKKAGFFLVPVVFILMFTVVVPRVFSGGVSKSSIILICVAMLAALFLFRPKRPATKSAETIAKDILDDYCADAFSQEEALKSRFYAALNDIGGNCPKAAVAKLKKLELLCAGSREKYAVAVASALAYRNQQDLKSAIREYNKAVVLNPTAGLAYTIGECNQRLGYLEKARDSYEFACELDPENPQYYSVIGTTYVGSGDYDTAMDYAMDALERDGNYSQALATLSICYGMKDDSVMQRHYQRLAAENGYSESKIEDTIKALKKR